MPITLLGLIKGSCNGLTREEIVTKAREEGIENPLEELKELIDAGTVRIDYDPKPVTYKATRQAFLT